MKVLMLRTLGEGEGRKKRYQAAGKTDFRRENEPVKRLTPPEMDSEDDIDPADFFDPEELGYRRRGFDASRP